MERSVRWSSRPRLERRPSAAEAADAEEDIALRPRQEAARSCPKLGCLDKKKRVEKIRRRRPIEAEAQAAAAAKAKAQAEERRQAEGRRTWAGPAASPIRRSLTPKRRRTSTDPESRIMKTKDGFIQGYNAQAAVDATAQVIVADGLDAKQ